MAFPNKVNIPISTNRVSNHDLSCTHITTSDFMQFSVAKAMELVPRQTIDVQHTMFTRLAPMPLPTFGYADIVNRAYFVPFRTVFPAWNDMIVDTPHIYDDGSIAIPSKVPTIKASIFNYLFTSNNEFAGSVPSGSEPDIIYSDNASSNPSLTKRKFTALGRFAYKLLRSLGYNWTFNNNESSRTFSVLPILCAARVYMDFYYPSAYSMDEESAWVQQFFVENTAAAESSNFFAAADLARLLKVLYRVAYERDYYTSAWDNPTGPNEGLSSNIYINDVSNRSNNGDSDYPLSIGNYSDGGTEMYNPEIIPSGGSSLNRITQFSLNALRGLSDYLKRHQLAGSRVIDRYLSRFGIKLPDANLNRCQFIGEFRQNLQFGDVTATADTDGAQLGAYAGKGVSYGQGDFDYSANEYGMFIVISVIRPQIGYYENTNRQVMHLTRTDFFTPEFDNLGAQAISNKEVYNSMDGSVTAGINEKIFGFVPRYAEYKVPFSQITGDFLCNSLNKGMDSWYMARSLKPYVDSVGGPASLVHSYEFVMGLDAGQYNRIFYNTESNADHFNIIHDFNIKSNFPGKSLYDNYEFENEDEAKKVSIPLNGTQH